MKRAALVGGLAVLAAVPLWIGSSYYINVATQILFYAIFALAVNILAGYAGLVSLGHAGLFGIAAYTGAKLMTVGHGHAVVAAGAVVTTVVAAAVFAVLALRGTGLGFVMITVALGQIVWGVAYRWISLTNGDNGITISGRPAPLGLGAGLAPRFLLGDLRRLPRRRPVDGDLRRLAVRRQRARHPGPAAPHERARLPRVDDPLPGLPPVRLLDRRGRAASTSTTTSS